MLISKDVDEVAESIVDHWNEYNGFWADFEYIGGNRIRIEDPDDSNKEPETGYVEQVPCI